MTEHRPSPLTRRNFLTGAAAAAGATAALGAWQPVLAQNGKPIPKAKARAPLADGEPIKIGVVGPGGMGTGHVDAITKLAKKGAENVQITALCDVCDTRLERAQQIIKERQGAEVDTYREHEDLLAREDLHGVLIATTEHWHGPISEDAIAAGKDVYVEKPMTLRLDEAVRLREVVMANPDMRLQVGTQYIAREKYRVAKRLIAEDRIGKPTFSQTSYCRNSMNGEWLYYNIDERWKPGENLDWERWCGPLGVREWNPEIYARWRRYKDFSTGIIGDLLVHEMTPLVMALDQGWPTRVVASGGHYVDKVMENHDQVNITVEFEKGHTMIVAGSTCNEKGLETMIRGHKANLYLANKDVVLRPERHWVDDIDEETFSCPPVSTHDAIRLNWLSCIRSREMNWSPVDLGTQVMVIVDLATRSMWEGRAFEFDRETMSARAV